jgi:hypothetical protein
MTAVFFVIRFDVAPTVIWIFQLPLDQDIRAVRVIRILLGLEHGLVVVAIAEDMVVATKVGWNRAAVASPFKAVFDFGVRKGSKAAIATILRSGMIDELRNLLTKRPSVTLSNFDFLTRSLPRRGCAIKSGVRSAASLRNACQPSKSSTLSRHRRRSER